MDLKTSVDKSIEVFNNDMETLKKDSSWFFEHENQVLWSKIHYNVNDLARTTLMLLDKLDNKEKDMLENINEEVSYTKASFATEANELQDMLVPHLTDHLYLYWDMNADIDVIKQTELTKALAPKWLDKYWYRYGIDFIHCMTNPAAEIKNYNLLDQTQGWFIRSLDKLENFDKEGFNSNLREYHSKEVEVNILSMYKNINSDPERKLHNLYEDILFLFKLEDLETLKFSISDANLYYLREALQLVKILQVKCYDRGLNVQAFEFIELFEFWEDMDVVQWMLLDRNSIEAYLNDS